MYKLYTFFDLDQLDTRTLDRYIQFLSPERKAKALRYRNITDKKTCIVSYLLLLHALYVNYGIKTPNISYSRTGKPYLAEQPNIHFNISHCPKGCICGISNHPIGIDIQDVRPFSQDVAKLCCSKDELLLLKQSNDPASEFTKMWTMKESYLKMTGTGITQNLTTIDTTKLHSKIPTFINNGCYIAVASAEFFLEESICLI